MISLRETALYSLMDFQPSLSPLLLLRLLATELSFFVLKLFPMINPPCYFEASQKVFEMLSV